MSLVLIALLLLPEVDGNMLRTTLWVPCPFKNCRNVQNDGFKNHFLNLPDPLLFFKSGMWNLRPEWAPASRSMVTATVPTAKAVATVVSRQRPRWQQRGNSVVIEISHAGRPQVAMARATETKAVGGRAGRMVQGVCVLIYPPEKLEGMLLQ